MRRRNRQGSKVMINGQRVRTNNSMTKLEVGEEDGSEGFKGHELAIIRGRYEGEVKEGHGGEMGQG